MNKVKKQPFNKAVIHRDFTKFMVKNYKSIYILITDEEAL